MAKASSLIDCPHCGQKTYGGGTYCSQCGEALPKSAPAVAAPEAQPAPAAKPAVNRSQNEVEATSRGRDGRYDIVVQVTKDGDGANAPGTRVLVAGIEAEDECAFLPGDGSIDATNNAITTNDKGAAIFVLQFYGKRRQLTFRVEGSQRDTDESRGIFRREGMLLKGAKPRVFWGVGFLRNFLIVRGWFKNESTEVPERDGSGKLSDWLGHMAGQFVYNNNLWPWAAVLVAITFTIVAVSAGKGKTFFKPELYTASQRLADIERAEESGALVDLIVSCGHPELIKEAIDPDDQDGDGMNDKWESEHGLDVTKDDSAKDPDGDGIINWSEFRGDTDPFQNDPVPVQMKWRYWVLAMLSWLGFFLLLVYSRTDEIGQFFEGFLSRATIGSKDKEPSSLAEGAKKGVFGFVAEFINRLLANFFGEVAGRAVMK